MDRLYNFFCFPLLLLGLIFISNGFVGFVENNTVDLGLSSYKFKDGYFAGNITGTLTDKTWEFLHGL